MILNGDEAKANDIGNVIMLMDVVGTFHVIAVVVWVVRGVDGPTAQVEITTTICTATLENVKAVMIHVMGLQNSCLWWAIAKVLPCKTCDL